MRKVLLLIVMCLCLTGCWRYGEGKTLGYVTTIETGIFWDYVWIRSDLQSSQTNAYAIRKDKADFKNALLESSKNKQRIELVYKNHIVLVSNIDPGGEAISFQVTN